MEMNLRMGINHKPRLSSTAYNNLQSFGEFKVDLHSIYIRVCKDPTKHWRELPFVATDDVIFDVLETWPLKWLLEWHTPDIATMEKSIAQKKKKDAKICMA